MVPSGPVMCQCKNAQPGYVREKANLEWCTTRLDVKNTVQEVKGTFAGAWVMYTPTAKVGACAACLSCAALRYDVMADEQSPSMTQTPSTR